MSVSKNARMAVGTLVCVTGTAWGGSIVYVDDDASGDPGPGNPVVFQNSSEPSCCFSVVRAENSAKSLSSDGRT